MSITLQFHTEQVVLVDPFNNELGYMEKMKAHRLAKLHRAISVFIFNDQGQLLLQRRARHKYHSGGLWTNTCCSHPRPGEPTINAANRRLREEMGLDCTLSFKFRFQYHTLLDNGLSEHELDFVYTGITNRIPLLNPLEADAYRWIGPEQLQNELNQNPEQFTAWFLIIYDQYRMELDIRNE
ncbi:MAG: isopentenyl-diphosphate Delta-isomerase [Bacteroidia bacterium]|jgi:isopentenyl-diphosphate delta-isomerase